MKANNFIIAFSYDEEAGIDMGAVADKLQSMGRCFMLIPNVVVLRIVSYVTPNYVAHKFREFTLNGLDMVVIPIDKEVIESISTTCNVER